MKRLLRTCLATGVTVSAAVVLAASGAQAAATPGWRYVAVYGQVSNMNSVSAFSATDAWVVGGPPYESSYLLTSHWNGKKWQTIAQPGGLNGSPNNYVSGGGVAAIGHGRAWLFVNRYNQYNGTSEVDAVEWTGTSWSALHVMPDSPYGIIASGPDDVWGFEVVNGTSWGIHYTGKSWSKVSIPVHVSADGGSAAAGDWVMGTVTAQPTRVEVLHWSKGAWRNAPLPAISVPKGDQMSVGAIAPALTPASIWATVALVPSNPFAQVTTILLHWNGKAWSKVPYPKGAGIGGIYGLASDGHGGLWTVNDFNFPAVQVLYHFSGGRWTHVNVPAKSAYSVPDLTSNLELIPGTRSILAGVAFSDGIHGGILKYGP